MKTKLQSILIFIIAISLAGCMTSYVQTQLMGNKKIVSVPIPISDFTQISCAFPLKVQYSQSTDAPAAVLKTDSNLVACFDIRVENGVLTIKRNTDKEYRQFNPIPSFCELIVNSSVLRDVTISGSGVVNVITPLNSSAISSSISGSGQVNFLYDVTSDKFFTSISGSGKMSTYKLQAKQIDISISGSGEAFMDEVYSDKFCANLAGSGNIETNRLNAHLIYNSLSGSGTILNGKVKSEKFENAISGSGTVRAEGFAKQAAYAISGSGKAETENLTANFVSNSISGSGRVFVTAVETIDSRIVGSGKLFYSGQPRTIYNNVQGSGGVIAR